MIFNGMVEDLFQSIQPFGVVAGTVDSSKISDPIDTFFPKTGSSSHPWSGHESDDPDGLGFVERRLYLYPNFL